MATSALSIAGTQPGPASPSRERLLFEALAGAEPEVSSRALLTVLEQAGIRRDDPRLAEVFGRLRRLETPETAVPRPLDYGAFVDIVKPGLLTVERAVTQHLVIPDFSTFTEDLEDIYRTTASNESGAVADYIPQLARVDPAQFGVAVTTIDGQRYSMGDATVPFSIQSTCKPVTYALALEEHDAEVVHRHVGSEPSGYGFNELTLNPRGLPHNPMINAGAIMSSSLIKSDRPMADRFDHVVDMWQRLAGGTRPTFGNSTYLSERRTADRNYALGYFMREHNAFPAGVDLQDTLEFYFQNCSLEMTTESLSVVAATLANAGACPITEERVLRPDTVQKVLSLMYSCGLYDFSGEWAFRIGLPAKSGVSGAILVVVPNVLGLAVWSPRLDELGNSVRGIDFCRELVRTFNFHNYDNLTGGRHDKKDPRRRPNQLRRDLLVDLCWAASEGDLNGIRRLMVEGADLDGADYDGRTPLHLAASEGQAHIVAFLIGQGVTPDPVDRWGNTPLDDARRAEHGEVVALLEKGG